MNRFLAAILVGATFVACGDPIVKVTNVPEDIFDDSPQSRTGLRPMRVDVYFACCESDTQASPEPDPSSSVDHLVPVVRGATGDGKTPNVESVLTTLFRGPGGVGEDELVTFIPTGTTYLGHTEIEPGVLSVNLSAHFQAAGTAQDAVIRVAQVVWTLTKIPGFRAVELLVNDEPIAVLTARGRTVKRPLVFEDFDDPFTPPTEVTGV